MEYNENLKTSLNLVTKYEIYHIIKLYAYLFIITSILVILRTLSDTSSWINGISLYIYLGLFSIPMVYVFILYFAIKSKTPNFVFEISKTLIFEVLVILAVLFLFPTSVYILIFPNDQSFFGNLYDFIPLVILFPSAFSLIFNFFLIKKFQYRNDYYIFIITGVILFLIWIFELIFGIYDIIPVIYFSVGIFLYGYSVIYLKR